MNNEYPKYLVNPNTKVHYKMMNRFLGFAIDPFGIVNIAEGHLPSSCEKTTKLRVDMAFKNYLKNIKLTYRGAVLSNEV